jgi:hypothetical protein
MYSTNRHNISKEIVSKLNTIKNASLFLTQIIGKLFSNIKKFLIRDIHKERTR